MRIGVDLRGLQTGHEFRGIGMYIRSIVEELFSQGIDSEHEITFYHYDSTDPLERLALPAAAKYKIAAFPNPKLPSANKTKADKGLAFMKEIIQNHFRWAPVPRTHGLDVFLQFDQQLGLPKSPFIKKVLVVHDLIPLVFKKQYLPNPFGMWLRHDWKMALKVAALNSRYYRGLSQIKRADLILAISEHTKEDLIHLLGVKPKKIRVAPNGGSHRPAVNPADLKQQTNFASSDTVDSIIERSQHSPFILFIGGPEPPRRRLDYLVTAYHLLRARGVNIQLVLAGKELASSKTVPHANTAKMIDELSYRDDMHLLGFVSDRDVNRLYEHALAFVFPTLYEGFGLPIVEAMEHNCPVITYNNSSIPEVTGQAAMLIEPGYESIISAVRQLMDEPKLSELLKERGLKQSKKYTWQAAAKKTIAAINELA